MFGGADEKLDLFMLQVRVSPALLQTLDFHGVLPRRSVARSLSRLEAKLFPEERDRLRKRRGSKTERSFDDARLAADIAREIEDRRLALA
jgi:hypothetical protein